MNMCTMNRNWGKWCWTLRSNGITDSDGKAEEGWLFHSRCCCRRRRRHQHQQLRDVGVALCGAPLVSKAVR